MKHFSVLLFVVLTVVSVSLLVGVATAQESNVSTDPVVEVSLTDNQSASESFETVDGNTRLVTSRHDDGVMVLIIESDKDQFITVTDAVAVMDGGTVPRSRFALSEGRNRVKFRVTKRDGWVAVTIDTRNTLFAVPIRTSTTWIGGPWSKSDAQNAGLAGLFAGLSVVTLAALRRVKGFSDTPERLL